MFNKGTFKLLLCTVAAIMLLALAAAQPALSDTATATVYGQVTLNGDPINGATVTCNGGSATTSSSIYNGFYSFALPIGKDYPITATYTSDGVTYTASDNIDLSGMTTAPTSPQGLSALDLKAVATPTPTPTPDPNATATPTPTPTATATPTPTPTATAQPTTKPSSGSHSVATPVYTVTPEPSPTVMPTPTPVPVARKIFSSPDWETDHETIIVNNTGDMPIMIRSWIGDTSNNVTVPIDAGATMMVLTPSIITQDNQIVDVGYDAYDNGVLVDTYKVSLFVGPTATPLPTTARSPGFAGIFGLICLLAAAYLLVRKEG